MTEHPQPRMRADTTWAPWSRDDPRALGRYVTREAARWVRLGADPVDLAQDPDTHRSRMVEAIYQGLVDRGIRYDREEYLPAAGMQSIRTPAEVLGGARRGTCLDLAALFCGICLGYDLLPVLVVLEGHALVLVSLTHDLADWDAPGREEQRALFADAPLRDPEPLRELVDRGAYLAVECTGFARAASLPGDLPEGSGREGLLLPFARAVAAGCEQLDWPDRPLRFAIDVATAWQEWRELPRWIGRHNTLRLDDGRRLELTEHGAVLTPDDEALSVWPLPTPVQPALRPHPGFLDRRHERDLARARATQEGVLLQFHGRAGVGRTALLRQLAHGELADALPDGTVYLRAEDQPLDDLLHDLFAAFYATDRPYRPTRSELVRRLRDLQALVLVDDARLRADHLQALLDAIPGSAFVLTSGHPVGAEGTAVEVTGLPVGDAVTLFARQLGRPLRPAEREAAGQLAATLQGHPGSLLVAAAFARDTGTALPDLAGRLAAADAPERLLTADALEPLAEPDQAILALLAGLNGAPLAMEHLRGIVRGPDVARSVARLKRLGLLQADQPHAALPEWLAVPLEDTVDTAPWMERALAHFTRWVEQHEDDPDLLLADAPALVAALRWAVAQHRWRTVLRLGRRVHGALLRGGRWGLALAVISWLVTGSTELGDDAAKAWALHQRGTQKQLTEDQDGTKDLEEAIRLREEFGDQAGRASQGSEAPAPASEAPVHPGMSAGAKVAITLAVAAVVVFVGVLVNRSISQADAPLPAIPGPTFTPGPTTTTLTPTTTSTTITATTRITTTTTELTTVTEPATTPPEPLVLPDVTRLTREEAVARLAQANLQAEADETFSDTVPEGVVISQAPAAGELVEPGSTVRLTISRGPEPPETSEPESAPID